MVTTTKAAPAETAAPRPTDRFRPEIQGLRAVAVLLVAVYHIWFGRVSGGVDVFLLLTGFFITGSLVRMVERHGRINVTAYLSRLAGRLLPPIAVVLAGVLVATYLWLPRSQWRDTLSQTVASALYYENWQLANDSVDYLARDNAAGPLQHFWSLSVQGQFYLLWPILLVAAMLVARLLGLGLRRSVFIGCAAVFAASLSYSVVKTASNQPWAYFDTGARLWEFGLGGMLAMALPLMNPPRAVRVLAGWIGLIGLVSCGALLQVSTMFPGWIALWPTGAALLVIVAGSTRTRWSADYLLTRRPVTYLGDISYSLYLWHWPILICYKQVLDRDEVTVLGGGYVLAASIALAIVTKWIAEDRARRFIQGLRGQAWSLSAAAVTLVPVLVATALWTADIDEQRRELQAMVEAAREHPTQYPGAAVLVDEELAGQLPQRPVLPPPSDPENLPIIYDDDCDARLHGAEVHLCEYGDPGADRTIALVGASRTAHWFPALHEMVRTNGWRLLVLTKSGCQFSTEPQMLNDQVNESCTQWRDEAMEVLADERPDYVFTSSTRAFAAGESASPGFVEMWQRLADLGIGVIGVRDLPRFDDRVPECVEQHGPQACVQNASPSHDPTDPALALAGVPDTVSLIDLTRYVCPDGRCPPVIGNVLTYRDNSHLTAMYAYTLAPMVTAEVVRITGWS